MNKNVSIWLLFLGLLIASSVFSNPVSLTDAQVVAKNFCKCNGFVNVNALTLVYSVKCDDSSAAFYTFNVNSKDGYVIIAADDAVIPILGYSNKRSFIINRASPELLFWLDGYAKQISVVKQKGFAATADIASQWNNYKKTSVIHPGVLGFSQSVAPLVSTNWDQVPFYNDSCPNKAVTGCVATTMAQIMKYWAYPPSGTGITESYYSSAVSNTLPSVDLSKIKYDWSKMPDRIDTSNAEIAQLMYHCGLSVMMQYSLNSSSAYVIKDANPICAEDAYVKYFGYAPATVKGLQRSNYSDSIWIGMLKNELDNGRPIQYVGSSIFGGHSWVMDGYDGNGMYHMNWGWSGVDDGYYTISQIVPSPIFGGVFSFYQEALIGIQPPCNQADLFITGQNIDKVNLVVGNTANVSFIERNAGKSAATNNIVSIYLSSSDTLDTANAIPFGQIAIPQVPASGNSDSLSATITIPTNLAAGQYYLYFKADSKNEVTECNKENNTAKIVIDVAATVCSTPINDEYTSAIALKYGLDSCIQTTDATSCGATFSAVDSNYNERTIADDDVFFKFVPTVSNATITVTPSSGYDAVFQVLKKFYYNTGPALYPLYPSGSWNVGTCVNDNGTGRTEKATFLNLQKDSVYYVRVWHAKTGWGTGNFSICVSGQSCIPTTAPTINAPGDTVSPGPTLTTTIPIFDWHDNYINAYFLSIDKEPYDSNSFVFADSCVHSGYGAYAMKPGILQSGTNYRWKVTSKSDCLANCGTDSRYRYFKVNTSTCPLPTIQPSNISITEITPNSMRLKWTKGNSEFTLVQINTTSSFPAPKYGNQPTIYYSYNGYGFQNIYYGSDSSMYVGGLLPQTNYCFRFYAANCTGLSTIFDTTITTSSIICQQSCTSFFYPIITSNKGDFSFCKGTSLGLTASAANCANCTYTWNNGSTDSAITVSPSMDTTYQVTASNGCYSLSNYQNVRVNLLDTPAISGYNLMCKGSGSNIYVFNNPYNSTYTWSDGAYGQSRYIQPDTTTTYTVTGKNNCGSATSKPFTVSVLSGVANADSIKGIDPTVYNQTFRYQVDSVPGATYYNWRTLGHGGTFDKNNSYNYYTNYTSSQPYADITWQSTGYTTDSLVVSAGNYCGSSKQMYRKIILPPCLPPAAPTIISSTGKFTVCSSLNSISLFASNASCYNCNYSWSANNSTFSYWSDITVYPKQTTTYTLTASNGCLPNASTSQNVTVNSYDVPSVSVSQSCSNDTATLTATTQNGGSFGYLNWQSWVDNAWQSIYTNSFQDTILQLVQPPKGTKIKCILYSNDPCRSKDTANAIVTLNCAGQTDAPADTVTISPNPNNGLFLLKMKLAVRQDVSYAIFSELGQLITQNDLGWVGGSFSKQIKVPNVATGNYFMVVNMDGKRKAIPIFIRKL